MSAGNIDRMMQVGTEPKGLGWLSSIREMVIVFGVGLCVFGAVSGDRLKTPSRDNHYVYLADAMLNGRLHLEGRPPHLNDWAKYKERWYVSFPPAPALLMLPGVAVFGFDFNDRIFTLFFAALGPALLFLLLRCLSAAQRLERKTWEQALLCAVFGIGTVYFFSAVQGTVWYTAHMVGIFFLLLFAICSLGGRHPILAGLFLGLAFACRPPMLFAFPFFFYEILRQYSGKPGIGVFEWLRRAVTLIGVRPLVRQTLMFGIPVVAVFGLIALMNLTRFDDPLEFGHKYLQIRWRGRIETWGLFNYHYLSRNLTTAFTLLPWLSSDPPYIGISRHGLAIWFTTPIFLWALWPVRRTRFITVLWITVGIMALPSLFYQNSGWVQFGYRFSLDYTAFLILIVALSRRTFGKLFIAMFVFSVAVNLFGALTFNRDWKYYPKESTATYFQPD
ncbi:MAG: hypothetical protein QNJ97_22430 [Myxococcota bacterium]|nr:hypothetical protein [Myxococcota bacterium]